MKHKTSGVYRITHVQTGMTYIGYSDDVEKRISKHKSRLRNKRTGSKFYLFWHETKGLDWEWTIIDLNPKDPKSAEIDAILNVPEHLRLNTVQYEYKVRINRTPEQISNKIRSTVESKNRNRTGFPGVTLQKNGRFKYKLSWPGRKIKERGFKTAKEAYDARVRKLEELNTEM